MISIAAGLIFLALAISTLMRDPIAQSMFKGVKNDTPSRASTHQIKYASDELLIRGNPSPMKKLGGKVRAGGPQEQATPARSQAVNFWNKRFENSLGTVEKNRLAVSKLLRSTELNITNQRKYGSASGSNATIRLSQSMKEPKSPQDDAQNKITFH